MKQRQKHWPWMSLLLQQLLQLCHKAPRLPVLWNPITLYITTSAVLAAEPFSELGREASGRLQKSFSMLCLQKLEACLYNTKAANWAVTQGQSFPTVHKTVFFTWALSLHKSSRSASSTRTTAELLLEHHLTPFPSLAADFLGKLNVAANSCSAFDHLSERGKWINRKKIMKIQGQVCKRPKGTTEE